MAPHVLADWQTKSEELTLGVHAKVPVKSNVFFFWHSPARYISPSLEELERIRGGLKRGIANKDHSQACSQSSPSATVQSSLESSATAPHPPAVEHQGRCAHAGALAAVAHGMV